MMAMNQAWLFNQGKNYQSYRMLGARPSTSPEGESVIGSPFGLPEHKLSVLSAISTVGIQIRIICSLTVQREFGKVSSLVRAIGNAINMQ